MCMTTGSAESESGRVRRLQEWDLGFRRMCGGPVAAIPNLVASADFGNGIEIPQHVQDRR